MHVFTARELHKAFLVYSVSSGLESCATWERIKPRDRSDIGIISVKETYSIAKLLVKKVSSMGMW